MSTVDLEELRHRVLSDGSARGWRRFGEDVGIDGETLRQFAKAQPGRKVHPETLDAIRRHYAPPAVPSDYWRGVLYAAEAMAETTARLLREARQSTDTDATRDELIAFTQRAAATHHAASSAPKSRQRKG